MNNTPTKVCYKQTYKHYMTLIIMLKLRNPEVTVGSVTLYGLVFYF